MEDPVVASQRIKDQTGQTPAEMVPKRPPINAAAIVSLLAGTMVQPLTAPFSRRLRRGGVHKHPDGPCRVCGQPNVRAGRERGVYLCREHLHLEGQEGAPQA